MKPGWKKQEEQEEKKERRKPTIEEIRIIERIMEEKEKKRGRFDRVEGNR